MQIMDDNTQCDNEEIGTYKRFKLFYVKMITYLESLQSTHAVSLILLYPVPVVDRIRGFGVNLQIRRCKYLFYHFVSSVTGFSNVKYQKHV